MNAAELTVIAALLHDIGKFWQRACDSPERPGGKRLWESHLQQYLPKNSDGGPSHLHAAWSGAFVLVHMPDFPEKESLAKAITAHHKPDELDEETRRVGLALSLADWLSSGERREDEAEAETGPGASTLRSVFGQVNLAPDAAPAARNFLLQRRSDFGDADTFFPVAEESTANTAEAYRRLWNEFESYVRSLGQWVLNVNTLYHLLSQYLARIPSATPWSGARTVPDISLFDHSRITAAVASCLAAQNLSAADLESLRTAFRHGGERCRTPLFRLIGGDMSGIQRFIYNLAGEHAARTLKGRSFFIQLLCEIIADFVCEELQLNRTCQIYCSGGRFYLLAMATGPAISSLQNKINARLRCFHGSLVLVLGEAALCMDDFKLERGTSENTRTGIAAKWIEVIRAADRAKRQKFSQLARGDYDNVFGHLDDAGEADRCPVCRTEHQRSAEDTCSLCESFGDLGKNLRKAKYLLFLHPDSSPRRDDYNAVLAEFGCQLLVADNLDLLPGEVERLKAVISINEYEPSFITDRFGQITTSPSISIGYRLLGTHYPESKESEGLITFEELANEAVGDRKLGILRADIDDLGRLFADGLGPYATFARVATLSRTLGDFFEGYVSHLLQNETYRAACVPADASAKSPPDTSPETLPDTPPFAERRFADTTALIYSGGDDLFLVGAWDAVVEAASRIQSDFRRYVGLDHPNFTLSCGIAVVQPKFPILLAAELAGEAESASKRFAGNGNGLPPKNAITLFGATVSWKDEFDRFQDLKNRIVYLLSPGQAKRPLPQGFLRKLYGVWGSWQNEERLLRRELERDGRSPEEIEQRLRWSRWRWLLVYSLRQYARDDNQHMVEEIQRMIQNDGIESRLGLPLRWAEQILKGGQ